MAVTVNERAAAIHQSVALTSSGLAQSLMNIHKKERQLCRLFSFESRRLTLWSIGRDERVRWVAIARSTPFDNQQKKEPSPIKEPHTSIAGIE